MRRAIVVQSDYRFMSALVGKDTAEVLQVGDQVKVTKDLILDHYGRVQAGEKAQVVFTDKDSGAVEIEFQRPLENLHEWRNCLLLTPYDSDDLIQGLALDSAVEAKEKGRSVRRFTPQLAAAAIILAFVLGWLAPGPFDAKYARANHMNMTLEDLETACKG